MARHRNVRGYNYDDDFDDEDLYGHSVEDDYGISPATAAQFIYSKRNRHLSFTEPLEEEENEDIEPKAADVALNAADQALMYSCLDQMREILGETVAEQVMIDAILQSKFDHAKALDLIFQQDCNLKTIAEDLPSGRTSKEAIFPSLQNLANEKYKHCPLVKTETPPDMCINTAHSNFSLKVGSTSEYTSQQSTDNTFIHSSYNLPLSTLLSNSAENLKPSLSKLSGISLEDLISVSKTDSCMKEESGLLGANCSELLHVIPGLEQTRTENTSSSSSNSSISIPSNEEYTSWNKLSSLKANNLQMRKKADSFGSLSSDLCKPENDQLSTIGIDVLVTKYGNPSLADLIQEHNGETAMLDISLDNPLKMSSEHKVKSEFLLPLSQLSDLSGTKFEMPLLTRSLSSLAVSESFEDTSSCSLSELFADVQKSGQNQVDCFSSGAIPLSEQNIDLTALINDPGSSPHRSVFHPKVLASGRFVSKPYERNTCCKKVHIHKNPPVEQIYGTNTLKARPSAFALSLCFNYIPKISKKNYTTVNQNHHYNSIALAGNSCPPTLVLFNFQTPSPDDIVKESQKKAIVR